MDEREEMPAGLGGRPVRRSKRGVHRPVGPWSPTVHAFLRHLEAVGFDGAPSLVEEDRDGDEVLTFVEGEVLAAGPTWRPGMPTPWPEWAQDDACLAATARLLRRFHDAAATFVPPADAVWRRPAAVTAGSGTAVCHGDIGPHNTVYRDGRPVALIDWDTIRPDDPLVELGTALWKYVPLGDDAYLAATDFAAPPDLPHRLEVFARAYGITDGAPVGWALHQAKQRSVESLRHFPVTPAEGAAELRRVAADLDWLARHLDRLLAPLD